MPHEVEYFRAVVGPLLSEPEKLEVTRTVDELGVLLTVKVSRPDMGRILGKEGKNIKAIRSVIHTYGQLTQSRINVKVDEPDGSRYIHARTELDEALSSITKES